MCSLRQSSGPAVQGQVQGYVFAVHHHPTNHEGNQPANQPPTFRCCPLQLLVHSSTSTAVLIIAPLLLRSPIANTSVFFVSCKRVGRLHTLPFSRALRWWAICLGPEWIHRPPSTGAPAREDRTPRFLGLRFRCVCAHQSLVLILHAVHNRTANRDAVPWSQAHSVLVAEFEPTLAKPRVLLCGRVQRPQLLPGLLAHPGNSDIFAWCMAL